MAGTPYLVDRGVVLRETETKETDKILTLLTWEQGKIGVIARGARRKNCKFAAAAQPLAYAEWTLYRRKDWHYASDASTLDLFSGLRGDLTALALGCYMAELTEAACPEDVPAPELLRHLLNGLYALSALHKPPALVKPAFELRLLCLAGYEPLADACAFCGVPEPEGAVLGVLGLPQAARPNSIAPVRMAARVFLSFMCCDPPFLIFDKNLRSRWNVTVQIL